MKEQQIQVLEASAGSGKTYALTKKYLELLTKDLHDKEQSPFKSILAITYTNKASIEMKERVIGALKKIALEDFKNEEEKALTKNLLNNKEYDKEIFVNLLDKIIQDYSFFQIKTIDSFVNSLIKGCSLDLGFSPDIVIEDMPNKDIELCLDSLFDMVKDDKEIRAIFSNFLGQYLILENKDNWMPKREILKTMMSLFNASTVYALPIKKSSFSFKEVIAKKSKLIQLFEALQNTLPEKTHKTFLKSLDKMVIEKNIKIDKLSAYFKRNEIPVNKGVDILPSQTDLWLQIKEEIRIYCEMHSKARYDSYIDIFNNAYQLLMNVQKQNNSVFLSELNQKASELFVKKGKLAAEIFYRLSSGIKDFLIDEFQDTSRLQWLNISSLVKSALDNGGTLFYVGDTKQSIYRFRGADLQLFDEVSKELGAYGVNKESLKNNYRSFEKIVEFNNRVFSQENISRFLKTYFQQESDKKDINNLTDKNIEKITEVFKTAQQLPVKTQEQGYLCIKEIEADSSAKRKEIIKEQTLDIIKELSQKYPLEQIAILTRSRADVLEATSWLIEESIPVQSDETLNIKTNNRIKELISFLKFLNEPEDNISFSGFITGEIFFKFSKIKKTDMQNFIINQRMKTLKDNNYCLIEDFKKDHSNLWETSIMPFIEKAGKVPLYEFLCSVIQFFGVLGEFNNEQAFFMKFLEIIKTKEVEYNDIAGFLSYFENAPSKDMYIDFEGAASVRVATIHQSKGLQYKAVILPFSKMNKRFSVSSKDGVKPHIVLSKEIEEDHEGSISLQMLNKAYAQYSPDLRTIYSEERVKSLIDDLNVLYVAFTRAEEEMYIFSEKNKENLLLGLTEISENTIGAKTKQRKIIKKDKPEIVEGIIVKDWIEMMSKQFKTKTEILNRQKIIKGEFLHSILSYIKVVNEKTLDKNIEDAYKKASVKYILAAREHNVKEKIKNIIKSKQLKEFFFVKEQDVFTEKEIYSEKNEFFIIDRLIMTAQQAIIIDYKARKNAESQQKYEDQIKRYKKVIQKMYPDKEVKGHIFFIEEEILELVKD